MELCSSNRCRGWRSESPPWKKPKVNHEFYGWESSADQIYDVDLPDEFSDDTCKEKRPEARSESPADKNPKQKEELDGWESTADKFFDMGLPDEFFDDIHVGTDPETAEQIIKHHRSYFECRGYDAVPPPKNWPGFLFRVVDLNNTKELRHMDKAAEHALSLYNDRRGKALKLYRVCRANYMLCSVGRAFHITFEAEDGNGARATYQTRVLSNEVGNDLEVDAFRPKPM